MPCNYAPLPRYCVRAVVKSSSDKMAYQGVQTTDELDVDYEDDLDVETPPTGCSGKWQSLPLWAKLGFTFVSIGALGECLVSLLENGARNRPAAEAHVPSCLHAAVIVKTTLRRLPRAEPSNGATACSSCGFVPVGPRWFSTCFFVNPPRSSHGGADNVVSARAGMGRAWLSRASACDMTLQLQSMIKFAPRMYVRHRPCSGSLPRPPFRQWRRLSRAAKQMVAAPCRDINVVS